MDSDQLKDQVRRLEGARASKTNAAFRSKLLALTDQDLVALRAYYGKQKTKVAEWRAAEILQTQIARDNRRARIPGNRKGGDYGKNNNHT